MNARRLVKALSATAIEWSGLRWAVAFGARQVAGGRRVVIVGYHRVCADFEGERQRGIETCLISRETFRAHLDYLARRFDLSTMSRAVEVLAGRARARRDLAVITFDDGYQDVLENALPILREFDAPATIYVSSGPVTSRGHFPHDRLFALLRAFEESPAMRARVPAETRETILRRGQAGAKAWLHDLIRDETPARLEGLIHELAHASDVLARPPHRSLALDWDGVRALCDGGFEIGAHTVSHAVLTNLEPDAVEREIRESKAAIERAVGRPVRHFAYCNGFWNEAVIRALVRAGYQSAVTTEDRLNRLGDDPFRLGRRVLWEGSARGLQDRTSRSMLACQLDGAWTAFGLRRPEPGRMPEPVPVPLSAPQQGTRRLA